LSSPSSPRRPNDELAGLRSNSLLRQLPPPGRASQKVGFASNDYLGLSNHPQLIAAATEAVQTHGVGSGSSRLLSGNCGAHLALEEALAEFKNQQAALSFSSGFATATGIIPAICQKDDVIIIDKLAHACLIDGARLSGATLRITAHNDLDKLASHLRWARSKRPANTRILIIAESIYSMDGDRCPLVEIIKLKNQFDALLLLDEAHATGIIGPEGKGLAAATGLESEVDFQMATLSKALGLSGGFIASSRPWIDLFINRARSFIFSTAPPPALAETALHALNLIQSDTGDTLRAKLHHNAHQLHSTLSKFTDHLPEPGQSPILPFLIGNEQDALEWSQNLEKHHVTAPCVRFPTVPKHKARIRFTATARHSDNDFKQLETALNVCRAPAT